MPWSSSSSRTEAGPGGRRASRVFVQTREARATGAARGPAEEHAAAQGKIGGCARMSVMMCCKHAGCKEERRGTTREEDAQTREEQGGGGADTEIQQGIKGFTQTYGK